MKKAVRIFLYCYDKGDLLANYCEALTAAGLYPAVSRRFDDCSACAGLLLPGGGDSDPRLYGQRNRACRGIDLGRDLMELRLVHRFASEGKPILGICRGCQLLNFAFGGDLIQDLPAHLRHTREASRDRLHDTTIAPDSFLGRLYGTRAVVNSAHHQAVGRPGAGFRIVQRARDGTAEAIEHESLPIWGLQWHPERQSGRRFRLGAADGAQVFAAFGALCAGSFPCACPFFQGVLS